VPHFLSGGVLSEYNNFGGPAVYGLPTTDQATEFGNVEGSAQTATFQHGAITVSNDNASETVGWMSVLQTGNQLTFSWHCYGPVDEVLVAYTENGVWHQPSGNYPTSGSYTLQVQPGQNYNFQVDPGIQWQGFLGTHGQNWSGWNFDVGTQYVTQ